MKLNENTPHVKNTENGKEEKKFKLFMWSGMRLWDIFLYFVG